ncbi:hypothetical protein [Pontibacter sp. SGAir0037]|uniref:hypothetical protein n=1 Tax=Pontibacter sp. SGAir0037 TaxID=2571030 RepID=UPI0010CD59A3|nr:hypothetical protein [Pontibacter sp. SGAir0037]QCR23523.1 hypothetical protein C1N53_15010 [Pontibacter sp. SGAir0037]
MENWNEERYKELNTYFRIKIEHMLRTDPQLQEWQQEGRKIDLKEMMAQFPKEDQERWQEFLELDQLKMQVDIWNHLNGKGIPYQPGFGFSNHEGDTSW